jgi:hypothetical protein
MNLEDIMRPVNYDKAQLKRRLASAEYAYSQSVLERAWAVERDAELASQCFESVSKGELFKVLGPITEREREVGLAFARYATWGRTDRV